MPPRSLPPFGNHVRQRLADVPFGTGACDDCFDGLSILGSSARGRAFLPSPPNSGFNMLKKSDCSLSIPGELIEALANEIAARVSAQLKETLATLNAQHRGRSAAPFGKAAQATYLKLCDVKVRTGLAGSTIYRKIQLGDFPAPVKLGARRVGWRRVDVERWEESPSTYAKHSHVPGP